MEKDELETVDFDKAIDGVYEELADEVEKLKESGRLLYFVREKAALDYIRDVKQGVDHKPFFMNSEEDDTPIRDRIEVLRPLMHQSTEMKELVKEYRTAYTVKHAFAQLEDHFK